LLLCIVLVHYIYELTQICGPKLLALKLYHLKKKSYKKMTIIFFIKIEVDD